MGKKRIPLKRVSLDTTNKKSSDKKSKKKKSTQPKQKIRVDEDRRSDDDKAYSYRIGTPLRDRITALAKEENVKISQLVKFLLHHALTEIEEGRLKIPVKPVEAKQDIDF